MSISFERAFSIHDNALQLRSRRSSILASNIANADTPRYKARDIDFNQVLKSVSDKSLAPLNMTRSNENHFGAGAMSTDPTVQYRNPLHPSLDGNTVDVHVEQARFSENALKYQASYTFLNGKISGLLKALKGE